MKKISLKDVKNGLERDEMRVVSGGCFGPDCMDVWGRPCGATTMCFNSYQCTNPNRSTCMNGYCVHRG